MNYTCLNRELGAFIESLREAMLGVWHLLNTPL